MHVDGVIVRPSHAHEMGRNLVTLVAVRAQFKEIRATESVG